MDPSPLEYIQVPKPLLERMAEVAILAYKPLVPYQLHSEESLLLDAYEERTRHIGTMLDLLSQAGVKITF